MNVFKLFFIACSGVALLSSCNQKEEKPLPQTKEEAIAILDELGVPRGYYGEAMLAAIEVNNMRNIKVMVTAGVKPDEPVSSYTNITPLHQAARYGNVECLKYFLGLPNVNPLVRTNGKRFTPREMVEDSCKNTSSEHMMGMMYMTFYCDNESDFVNCSQIPNNKYIKRLRDNWKECIKLLSEAEKIYQNKE